jgi:hypothetical protein
LTDALRNLQQPQSSAYGDSGLPYSVTLDAKLLPKFQPIQGLAAFTTFRSGHVSYWSTNAHKFGDHVKQQVSVIFNSADAAGQAFLKEHEEPLSKMCPAAAPHLKIILSTVGGLSQLVDVYGKPTMASQLLAVTKALDREDATDPALMGPVRLTAPWPPGPLPFPDAFLLVAERFLCIPAPSELGIWQRGLKQGEVNTINKTVPKDEDPRSFAKRTADMFDLFSKYAQNEFADDSGCTKSLLQVFRDGLHDRLQPSVDSELMRIGVLHTSPAVQLGRATKAAQCAHEYFVKQETLVLSQQDERPRVRDGLTRKPAGCNATEVQPGSANPSEDPDRSSSTSPSGAPPDKSTEFIMHPRNTKPQGGGTKWGDGKPKGPSHGQSQEQGGQAASKPYPDRDAANYCALCNNNRHATHLCHRYQDMLRDANYRFTERQKAMMGRGITPIAMSPAALSGQSPAQAPVHVAATQPVAQVATATGTFKGPPIPYHDRPMCSYNSATPSTRYEDGGGYMGYPYEDVFSQMAFARPLGNDVPLFEAVKPASAVRSPSVDVDQARAANLFAALRLSPDPTLHPSLDELMAEMESCASAVISVRSRLQALSTSASALLSSNGARGGLEFKTAHKKFPVSWVLSPEELKKKGVVSGECKSAPPAAPPVFAFGEVFEPPEVDPKPEHKAVLPVPIPVVLDPPVKPVVLPSMPSVPMAPVLPVRKRPESFEVIMPSASDWCSFSARADVPDEITSYFSDLSAGLTYFENPPDDPGKCVGIVAGGQRYLPDKTLVDGGSNVNILDEGEVEKMGVPVFPVPIRLNTSNGTDTSVLGATRRLAVQYGDGPHAIVSHHCFLVVPRRKGASYTALFGNPDHKRYGVLMDTGAHAFVMRPEFSVRGLASSVLAFPTVVCPP